MKQGETKVVRNGSRVRSRGSVMVKPDNGLGVNSNRVTVMRGGYLAISQDDPVDGGIAEAGKRGEEDEGSE